MAHRPYAFTSLVSATIFGIRAAFEKGSARTSLNYNAHVISAWEEIQKRYDTSGTTAAVDYFLSHMIVLREKYSMGMDYFTEYHGKNQCYCHFSGIMVIYNNCTLGKDVLVTTDEILHNDGDQILTMSQSNSSM
ncbi:hypothetical protein PROFUN_13496 [Planoprotostelium fungivorum]|uniref:Uncharacterized protein n=1 Tax=Planoprotostelium fungivorum TaxID=1890364 RepID=A0A2P6N3Z8_9EUKA|nr:hypothetical protein PROFUN_13496 [Planoprotostelium fungivorum]